MTAVFAVVPRLQNPDTRLPWRACTGSVEYCRSEGEYPRTCKRFLEWLLSACCSQGSGHAPDLEACAAADPESAMLRRYWSSGTRHEREALRYWMDPEPTASVHAHSPTWAEFVKGSEFTWYPGGNR